MDVFLAEHPHQLRIFAVIPGKMINVKYLILMSVIFSSNILTGSHSSVSKFISSVRLAFVTSVICIPPFGPPVKFCWISEVTWIRWMQFQTQKCLTRCQWPHPYEPCIDSTDEACFICECFINFRYIFFEPHQFERRKIWTDWQSWDLLEMVGITIRNFVQ